MFIANDTTFTTARARVAAFEAFKRDLQLCDDAEMVDIAVNEHSDTFNKLREEKAQDRDWHGFEYLEAMQEAISKRHEELSLTTYFTEK